MTSKKKTRVAIVYALDSTKGSESGMGYNFAFNLQTIHPDLTIITRNNNVNHDLKNVIYFDLPQWILKLKKITKFHLLYCVIWQLALSFRYRKSFDIVYQINFHSDWLPLFSYRIAIESWIVGPVGHHGSLNMLKQQWNYNKLFAIFESFKLLYKFLIFNLWNKFQFKQFGTRIFVLNRKPWIKEKNVRYLPSVGVESFIQNNVVKKQNQVIYVGRLVHLKGVGVLPGVIRKNPEFDFIIIGDGPQRKTLMKKCTGLNNVRFTGWLNRAEVLNYFEQSRFLLFPSFEGAGMVVAEAGKSRCWPIVLRNSGPNELLESNCTVVNNICDFEELNISSINPRLDDLSEYVFNNLLFEKKNLDF